MNRQKLIRRILELSFKSKEGHIPSSLSILDMLYTIYKHKEDNDQFVLSKGHAALGLYVILEEFNKLNSSLEDFCSFNSNFGGHPCSQNKEILASTGSLGHGLPISVGMAMAKKIQNQNGKVFVIIGDGECNEGSIWESALLASHHKLDNLYCLVDYNHSGDRAISLHDLKDKFKSFNWNTVNINGHDHNALKNFIDNKNSHSIPSIAICNTIKGYGIDAMENSPEWHHKIPNQDQIKEWTEHA